MGFKKSGEVTIAKVFCKCGAELANAAATCPKCGKKILTKKKEEKETK